MPSAEHTEGAEHVTFEIFRTDGPATAGALVEAAKGLLDPVTARVHTALDDMAVVIRTVRPDAASSHTTGKLADHAGVLSTTTFQGTSVPGLTGPEAGREPGIVAVATRHFAGRDSAAAVLRLLAGSGEWKRDFPGFISATPYLSPDGRTFVNYPMWVDEAAYRAWMADPRIAEGQEEIARLEVAPPEYLVCRVT
ncbi:antibiotic biosynthesis monooxygenase [Spirillospora sp. NPDC000708]